MKKHLFEGLDILFRNYRLACLSPLVGMVIVHGFALAFMEHIKFENTLFGLAGGLVGTIICLIFMYFMKSQFHSKIQSKLQGEQKPA
jgi:hypothetical protein